MVFGRATGVHLIWDHSNCTSQMKCARGLIPHVPGPLVDPLCRAIEWIVLRIHYPVEISQLSLYLIVHFVIGYKESLRSCYGYTDAIQQKYKIHC